HPLSHSFYYNCGMKGTWETADIAGKRADVYEPAGSLPPRFGILHLHGLGLETLRDRVAFTLLFDELNLACICPHGARSWWAGRICTEFAAEVTPERYLLESVVPVFYDRWQLRPRAIGLQGISMGGQGALRLGFKFPETFPVVAAISA